MSALTHVKAIRSSIFIRVAVLFYGSAAYATFLGTFLYAIGFVAQVVVPKTLDIGVVSPWPQALLVNIALLSLFAIQHSGMARQGFKRLFARVALPALERSTYVLAASLSLLLLFWQWRPIPDLVWSVDSPDLAIAIKAISFLGWLIVLYSTLFLISHFELFGVTQVISHLVGRVVEPIKFRTPGLYRFVRHPIYLGFIIAFWATPSMTVGHLMFAAVTTGYILIGIWLEERDLISLFGNEYRRYRDRVAMLFPGLL